MSVLMLCVSAEKAVKHHGNSSCCHIEQKKQGQPLHTDGDAWCPCYPPFRHHTNHTKGDIIITFHSNKCHRQDEASLLACIDPTTLTIDTGGPQAIAHRQFPRMPKCRTCMPVINSNGNIHTGLTPQEQRLQCTIWQRLHPNPHPETGSPCCS